MRTAIYDNIVSDLLKSSDKEKVKLDKFYNKKEGYVSYGVSSLKFKEIVRKYKPTIKGISKMDVVSLLRSLYNSGIEEQKYFANATALLRSEVFGPKDLRIFDKALGDFRTWGTVDDFCVHVLWKFLDRYPEETYQYLKRWNKSRNMWKKRASVVAFTRKAGESGRFTDWALELCENLIHDKEDLVQKGVGWCLKDIMRGEKKKVFEYLMNIRKIGVSSVIVLYAIRDLSKTERLKVLETKLKKV